ncbi:peptidyl-tRNA hydrolase II [Armillaria solidipes]|uniref:peptidyl-tRNA hydrolase n=1 Tax=Armillaria solidipes TaxID=1076256 RepID=A0A2H3C590_9AGAR|nr:peptidyl-tRNA hydrolase II [Armillaria solidipes]
MSRSPIIISLALGAASGALGFFVGYLRHRPDDNQTKMLEPEPEPEDEEDIPDGDLSAVLARFLEPCKLVLIVRTDLKMGSGKISAQCGDATLACYKALVKKNSSLVGHWERTGQAKIALKASSEEQILELEAIAKSLNLCARSIKDQGTTAVLGIGPAPVKLVNEVTGKLRLL